MNALRAELKQLSMMKILKRTVEARNVLDVMMRNMLMRKELILLVDD